MSSSNLSTKYVVGVIDDKSDSLRAIAATLRDYFAAKNFIAFDVIVGISFEEMIGNLAILQNAEPNRQIDLFAVIVDKNMGDGENDWDKSWGERNLQQAKVQLPSAIRIYYSMNHVESNVGRIMLHGLAHFVCPGDVHLLADALFKIAERQVWQKLAEETARQTMQGLNEWYKRKKGASVEVKFRMVDNKRIVEKSSEELLSNAEQMNKLIRAVCFNSIKQAAVL